MIYKDITYAEVKNINVSILFFIHIHLFSIYVVGCCWTAKQNNRSL